MEAADLYEACIAAGIPIPSGMCRVDARFTEEQGWTDSQGVPIEFPAGWATEPVQIPSEFNFMTCGVDLETQTFSPVAPTELLPVLYGSPAVAPPVPTCPQGEDWTYINQDFCLQ